MRDQELIGLYEAYQQVHKLQEEETGAGPRLQDPYDVRDAKGGPKGGGKIRGRRMRGVIRKEEVEIASHYFCEMGLNEIGVEILIEELGVEEFAEFVYDISEDYYLTEARAAKKRTGGKSYAEVKAEIDNKEAAKKKVKDEKQSAAVAAAANQQPKKKGLLGRVADAVAAGIDRHNYAMKASEKTAGKIGKAAREFRRGLMSSYDNWVGQLISDGYDLSNWTDEGLFEYYEQLCEKSVEIGQSPTPGGMNKPKKPVTSAIPPLPRRGTPVNTGYKESYDEPNVLGKFIDAGAGAVKKPIENFANRKVGGIPGALGIPGRIAGQKVDQTAQQLKDKDFGGALKTVTGGVRSLMQSYDLYDTILEYLITEGYADTNENALVIMANMSEEWREEIINEAAADQSDNQIEKGVKTTYKAQGVLVNHRSPGLNRVPYADRKAKVKRMEARLKTRRDDLFGERNRREDETRAEMKRKYGL